MRIIINTAVLRFGGAVQVALSFINECIKFNENEYHVFVGPGIRKSLRKDVFPDNFYFYDFDFGPVNIIKTFKVTSQLKKFEKIINPDCVVTTSGPSYWNSKAPQLMGFNLPLYLYYDSPYFNLISSYKKFRLTFKKRIQYYYFKRDANSYIVQTDDVNKRLRKDLDAVKVFTVSNTYNNFFIDQHTFINKLPPSSNNGEIRLLTLTSYYRHKNIEIIPAICDELKKRAYNNIKFILTIDNKNYDRIFRKDYGNNVINIGSVKPEECPSLYKECDFMFLPTLAECFSASYPEAMIMKKPIITTDLSFARDICKDAALYFEALNPVSAANKIEKLINDKQLQKKLIKNGLKRLRDFNSPQERALKILKICHSMINEETENFNI